MQLALRIALVLVASGLLFSILVFADPLLDESINSAVDDQLLQDLDLLMDLDYSDQHVTDLLQKTTLIEEPIKEPLEATPILINEKVHFCYGRCENIPSLVE